MEVISLPPVHGLAKEEIYSCIGKSEAFWGTLCFDCPCRVRMQDQEPRFWFAESGLGARRWLRLQAAE
jgi:hypothetical protein